MRSSLLCWATVASGEHFTDTERVGRPYESDSGRFARSTRLSYAYADIALSAAWIVALAVHAPARTVFLPGLITGLGAVVVDFAWMYRVGKRRIELNGETPSSFFVGWWLVGWFEFLIAFNMGTYVGYVLHVGLTSDAGLTLTALYLGWFWLLAPLGDRLLRALGIGRAVVVTTREWGSKLSWGRLGAVVVLYAVAWVLALAPDVRALLELLALGMITALGMELPLFVLGIRPGRKAWQALVLNTLVEWNYAVPILYLLLRALGVDTYA